MEKVEEEKAKLSDCIDRIYEITYLISGVLTQTIIAKLTGIERIGAPLLVFDNGETLLNGNKIISMIEVYEE